MKTHEVYDKFSEKNVCFPQLKMIENYSSDVSDSVPITLYLIKNGSCLCD